PLLFPQQITPPSCLIAAAGDGRVGGAPLLRTESQVRTAAPVPAHDAVSVGIGIELFGLEVAQIEGFREVAHAALGIALGVDLGKEVVGDAGSRYLHRVG